jgi:hypothetical protein
MFQGPSLFPSSGSDDRENRRNFDKRLPDNMRHISESSIFHIHRCENLKHNTCILFDDAVNNSSYMASESRMSSEELILKDAEGSRLDLI